MSSHSPGRRITFRFTVSMALAAALCIPMAGETKFIRRELADGLKGGYQVGAVDVNGDGRPDLVALASGMSELVWFENPGWERRVLAGGFKRLINFAAWCRGGSRIPTFVVASGFSMEAKGSSGEIWVLEQRGDPREPWTATEIDRLPTSHRLRWANLGGPDGMVVVNAPLTGADAGGPDYRGRTPLICYHPSDWKRRVIDETNEGVVHGLDVLDWDGDGRDEILTASFQGLHLFRNTAAGWTRRELARGNPAPWPKCGSSEIAVGRVAGRRVLAAIEPWHGHEVVVYTERGGSWQRRVIDDSLDEGHTVSLADLDGDGADEIVAGCRGKRHAVYIYHATDEGAVRWRRTLLDDGVAAASCAIADLDGDGRLDIACIGSSTANLVWYRNAARGR